MTFNCNFCNKGFTSWNQLSQHLDDKGHHTSNRNQPKSLVCGCRVTDWTRCNCGHYQREQSMRGGTYKGD
jgi:hypothetical protein